MFNNEFNNGSNNKLHKGRAFYGKYWLSRGKKEITKLFRTKDGGRKVIFWYDPPMNFKEDILSDSYDCCQVLLCDKNEFFIKKTIA